MMMNLGLTKKTSKITFPVFFKKNQSLLLSHDLVSVQALPLPEGRLFYMDFGESEEMRIARYEKEEQDAYSKEVDAYINDTGRFKFVSPGINFRERDITVIQAAGMEYIADYSVHYSDRSIINHGGHIYNVKEYFELLNKKRIVALEQEDFESYDHELMVYLN